MAQILRDCFGARLDVKLFINAAKVRANGIDADVQLIGDLFVSEPLSKAIQDHFLARGKMSRLLSGLF